MTRLVSFNSSAIARWRRAISRTASIENGAAPVPKFGAAMDPGDPPATGTIVVSPFRVEKSQPGAPSTRGRRPRAHPGLGTWCGRCRAWSNSRVDRCDQAVFSIVEKFSARRNLHEFRVVVRPGAERQGLAVVGHHVRRSLLCAPVQGNEIHLGPQFDPPRAVLQLPVDAVEGLGHDLPDRKHLAAFDLAVVADRGLEDLDFCGLFKWRNM